MSGKQGSSKQHRVRVATKVLNKWGCDISHIKDEGHFEVQFPSKRSGELYRPNENELIKLALRVLKAKREMGINP